MGSAIRLGSLFGIPIRLHFTWFIIFTLVTISLAWQYFPVAYPRWSPLEHWAVGMATSLLFFASVVAHELSHSLVSKATGVPVKSITLFIFGGLARIAREAARPSAELVMALAGPLCSLAIGGLFAAIYFLAGAASEHLAALAGWLARINILLALFNLIPGFPLDGGRVLRSLLWRATGNFRRSTRIASWIGRGIAYGFILGGLAIIFFGEWFSGLWLAFIGWFLDNAASSSYHQAVLRDYLQGFTGADVMTQDCPTVPPHLTLDELVQGYILPTGRRCFFVAEGERLVGIVTLHNVKAVPQQRWQFTRLAEAMTPSDKLKVARPGDDALSILEQMDEEDINQMPVVSQGRVIGMIGRDNLLHFIRTRSELGM